ncbi:MAG TPA: tRNA (guanosine(37)-N1)-methyltransferase TrmD [bacterium]|nr:tRNA (guanosine(37)-N1)-methyltransferase TrmD [bacterium]
MEFIFLTLNPEMLDGIFKEGIIKEAINTNKIKIKLINFREYALDRHQIVDDTPYGGGSGMLLKPEPIIRAFEDIELKPRCRVIMPTPAGKRFHQRTAKRLLNYDQLIFICGRYEGIDERVSEILQPLKISIGDYILSNGEIAAAAIFNAIARLIDGVLGNPLSLIEESFENGMLEYPQYTRPECYRGLSVPEILKSGHHKLINDWRLSESKKITEKIKNS